MDLESRTCLALVGNWRYPRYAVTYNRSRFSPTLYWTGVVEQPWTTEVSEAMRWADYEAAELALGEIESAESDDSHGRK
jgi:hypothetical protein